MGLLTKASSVPASLLMEGDVPASSREVHRSSPPLVRAQLAAEAGPDGKTEAAAALATWSPGAPTLGEEWLASGKKGMSPW